jgi:hypothetical protein
MALAWFLRASLGVPFSLSQRSPAARRGDADHDTIKLVEVIANYLKLQRLIAFLELAKVS